MRALARARLAIQATCERPPGRRGPAPPGYARGVPPVPFAR